jgi:glycosyltransferase involved in cell wall biosynthesis
LTSRVVYVSHSKEVGGAEVYLEGLIGHAVTRLGLDVELVCRTDSVLDPLVSRVAALGVTVHRLDLRRPADYLRVGRVLRSASVVHLMVAYPAGKYQLAIALLAAGTRRCLVASHLLSIDIRTTGMSWWRRRLWQVLFRSYALTARWNIPVSRAGWNVLVKGYGFPERSTRLIHNGTDLGRFKQLTKGERSRARAALVAAVGLEHLSRRAAIAVTVARLSTQKGLYDLIDAAAAVVSRLPEANFVLVGDGELRDGLIRRVGELRLGERFRFAGARPAAEVARWLAATDVFVLSSHQEGLPLALLEAMASGCPVVATDVGGVGEVVSDGVVGRLVPAADPGRLAEAIEEVLADPEGRARMGAAARARVIEAFDASACYERTAALYHEVAPR